ncbi:hypothetical protein GJ496_006624 [Pomphorhynchus laevis]|nr:hypothetical protein GJ496_006624 [Pomphorhynchus laevis]
MNQKELTYLSKIVKSSDDTVLSESEREIADKGLKYAEDNLNRIRCHIEKLNSSDNIKQESVTDKVHDMCKHWEIYAGKLQTLLKNKPRQENDPNEVQLTFFADEKSKKSEPQSNTHNFSTGVCSNKRKRGSRKRRSSTSEIITPKIAKANLSSTTKLRPSDFDCIPNHDLLQPVDLYRRRGDSDVLLFKDDSNNTESKSTVSTMTEPGYFCTSFVDSMEPNCNFFGNPRERIVLTIDHEALNQIAVECIVSISEEGRHVTWDKVLGRLCCRLQINDLAHIGIRRAIDIPAVSSLTRMNDRINLYMNAYKFLQPIGTLHDVDLALAQLFGRDRFDDLCIGPLVRHPAVRNVFQIPDKIGTSIPIVTTCDVLYYLLRFMSEGKLWNSALNVGEFIEFLKTELRVQSPYELGIRVRSFGPALSALKSVQRSRKQMLDQSREKLRRDLLQMCQNEMSKIKDELKEKLSRKSSLDENDSVDSIINNQRRRYIEMPASAVIVDILESCRLLFEKAPFYEKLRDFLYHIQKDKLLRKLFQVAISAGRLALPEEAIPPALKRKLEAKRIPSASAVSSSDRNSECCITSDSSSSDESDSEQADNQIQNKMSKHIFDSNLVDFIRQCLDSLVDCTPGALFSTEQRTLEHFGCTTNKFSDLNSAGLSFLQFLHSYRLLSSFKQSTQVPDYVMNALMQINDIAKWPDVILDNVISYYFNINNTGRLKLAVKEAKTKYNVIRPFAVISPIPLFGPKSPFGSIVSVNFQSNLSIFDAAANRLKQCPLLVDLYEFSHWKILFESKLGSLSMFLRSNNIGHVIAFDDPISNALLCLTCDETLLTIDQISSVGGEAMSNSLYCSHFVGLILSFLLVKHRSVFETMPFALLSNVLHSVMLTCVDAAAVFVLNCLCLLPSCLLEPLALRIFLEPFSRLQGSMTSARDILRQSAKGKSLFVIERLGFLYGFRDWSADFENVQVAPSFSVFHLLEQNLQKNSSNKQLRKDNDKIKYASHVDVDVKKSVVYSETTIPHFVEEDHVSSEESSPDIINPTVEENYCDTTIEASSSPITIAIDESAAFAHIERLRRDRFGIGIDLSDDGNRLADSLRNLIGRSLDRLSKELYNCDMHFVLELIQNADDNRYSRGHIPQIRFEINSSEIKVYNNELGFQSSDIDAICDVGKSTKGSHRSGYIGHKGIGFKSVFAVSNYPEIHSSAYHIGFNVEKDGSVGYILPEWIPRNNRDYDKKWTTLIRLPLKSETERERHKARSLASSFHDIQPTLLLFLNRLVQIQILSDDLVEHRFSRRATTILQQQTGDTSKSLNISLIELNIQSINTITRAASNGKTESWLVIKRSFKVPATLCNHNRFQTSDIAIALPICEKVFAIASGQITDEKHFALSQDVFAFLPVRSFGLPFIVQADFELPSHRQDLKENSEWNEWLLLQIPQLFVDTVPMAIRKFVNCDECYASRLLLHFIPTIERVTGLFTSVATEIVRLVSRRAFMLCSDGQMRIPSSTALPDQQGMILTEQILNTHLGLSYIDHIVPKLVSESVLRDLDVQTIDFNHILDAAQILDINNVELAGQWVRCLAAILPNLNISKERDLIARFRNLPIIPLQSSSTKTQNSPSLVKLADVDGLIFLPPENYDQLIKMENSSWKRLIYESILTVNLSILLSGSSATGIYRQTDEQNIRVLLSRAGVRQMVPHDIFNTHICSILSASPSSFDIDVIHQNLLVACVLFTFDLWKQDNNLVDIENFSKIVRLKTNNGFLNPTTDVINFTCYYGNKYNLETEFPDQNWSLIDRCYLDMTCNSSCDNSLSSLSNTITIGDRMRWRTFLDKLGLVDLVGVRQRNFTMSVDEFCSVYRAENFDFRKSASDQTIAVDDWICTQFEDIVKCPDQSANNFITLFKALEENWNSSYDMYKILKVSTASTNEQLFTMDSSFFKNLKTLKWLCCTSPYDHSSIVYHTSHNTYIDCATTRQLLTDHVPYLRTDIDHRSLFSQDIGIISTIDANKMLSILIEWSRDIKLLDFDISHLTYVYEFLWRSLDHQVIQAAFLANNLIYTCEDKFVNRFGVHWKDPTNLFQTYTVGKSNCYDDNIFADIFQCKFLSPFYPDRLKDFFIYIASVSEMPSINEYIRLIEYIIMENDLTRDNRRMSLNDENLLTESLALSTCTDVFQIFDEIGRQCKQLIKQNEDSEVSINEIKTSIQDLIRGKQIFPSTSNKWSASSRFLIVPDDKQLYDKFCVVLQHNAAVTNSVASEQTSFLLIPNCQVSTPALTRNNNYGLLSNLSLTQRMLIVKLCELPTLSSSLIKEVNVESAKANGNLQNFLAQFVPCLQRFMLQHCSAQYKLLNENLYPTISEKLKKMHFFTVSKLEVIYRLKQNPTISVVIPEQCVYQDNDEGSYNLYVDRCSVDDHRTIIRSFATIFSCGDVDINRNLCNFLILLREEFNNLENFAKYQDFSLSLPNQHQYNWSIPNANFEDSNMFDDCRDNPDPQKVKAFLSLTESTCRQSIQVKSKQGTVKKSNDLGIAERNQTISWPPPNPESQSYPRSILNTSGSLHSKSTNPERQTNSISITTPSNTGTMQTSEPNIISNELCNQYSIQYNAPPSIEEIEIETLILPNFEPPTLIKCNSDDNNISTGLWGERLVFHHLLNIHREEIEAGNVTVQWINSACETSAPYDLVIRFPKTNRQMLIEVKSTSDEEQNSFPLSIQQLRLALENPDGYEIYRVYNAGRMDGSPPKLRIINDITRKLENKMIQLWMTI